MDVTGDESKVRCCKNDIEWFALETSRVHSVIFEMYPSTAFWTLFFEYECHSIPSKGLLPTAVDIMVI